MFNGICISEGIGIGAAYVVNNSQARPCIEESSKINVVDIPAEKERFHQTKEIFISETRRKFDILSNKINSNDADILFAHTVIVKDEGFSNTVFQLIEEQYSCKDAIIKAINQLKKLFSQSEDEVLCLKVADLNDIEVSFLRILDGLSGTSFFVPDKETVLITDELFPSMIAEMIDSKVMAVIVKNIAINSHAAILARAAEIPVISSNMLFDETKNGNMIIADAIDGIIYINPDEVLFRKYSLKQLQIMKEKDELCKYIDVQTFTRDGKRIRLHANVASVDDVKTAIKYNADGIGLLRTEHIFGKYKSMPDVKQQYAEYSYISNSFRDKPVIIRTLDIGGDKKLPYFEFHDEQNPFLGHRGIRFCEDNSDILKTQLKAIFMAAEEHENIQILLPMISTVDEVLFVKRIMQEIATELACNTLKAEELLQKCRIGVMIETSSAVFIAEHLAQHVDFFSLGTNDLTQYIMAADRTNPMVSRLYSHYQPAVLKAISMTALIAAKNHLELEICGEAAADILIIPILIGMGIDTFSVSPSAILKVRKAIAECDYEKACKDVKQVLSFETAAEVKRYLLMNK